MSYVVKTKVRTYYKNTTVLESSTAGNYPYTLADNGILHEVTLVGAGGGSSTSPAGAGGGVVLRVHLEADTYNCTVGKGGDGASAYARNNNGKNGTASNILGGNVFIEALFGTFGGGRRVGRQVGVVGNISINAENVSIIKRNAPGVASTLSFITDDNTGPGAGGTAVGDEDAGIAGKDGYIKIVRKDVVPEGADYDDYEDIVKPHLVKTKVRTYTNKFTLPELFSNGVMGGDTFACACSTLKDNAYQCFNNGSDWSGGIDTNPNAAPQWLSFYNPTPLKVTKLRLGQIKNAAEQNNYYITAWKIQVSDDNEEWTDVWSGTATAPAQTLVAEIADSGYHKYYRIYVVSANYYSGYPRVFFNGVDFEAEAENAIYFTDDIKSYVLKRKVLKYYKYTYEDWELPNFTGYAAAGGETVSATNESTQYGRLAWKALQSSAQPAANTNDNYGRQNVASAQWRLKLPYLVKLLKLEHQARNYNNPDDYNTVGSFYADDLRTKKIGDVNSSSSGAWTSWNTDFATDTLVLDMNGGGLWSGIGRLRITAKKITVKIEVPASEYFEPVSSGAPQVSMGTNIAKVYFSKAQGYLYWKKEDWDNASVGGFVPQTDKDGNYILNDYVLHKADKSSVIVAGAVLIGSAVFYEYIEE